MKLSIIIPVYNCERFIGRCVNEIDKSLLPIIAPIELEVILINDGSKDNSEYICNTLCERFDYVKSLSQTNRGASSARNRGLDIATGDWIWFIDADDTICKDGIREIASSLRNTNCDIVAFNHLRKSKSGDVICKQYKEAAISDSVNFLNNNPSMYLWNKIYRRSTIGDTRFLEGTKNIEDFLFNIEIFCKDIQIQELAAIGYNYDDSNTDSTSRSRTKRNLVKIHQDSFAVHNKIIQILNFIDDINIQKAVDGLLRFSILGHLYSLSVYYNNRHIRKAIAWYKDKNYYPVKEVKNKRANVFRKIANSPLLLQLFSILKRCNKNK